MCYCPVIALLMTIEMVIVVVFMSFSNGDDWSFFYQVEN